MTQMKIGNKEFDSPASGHNSSSLGGPQFMDVAERARHDLKQLEQQQQHIVYRVLELQGEEDGLAPGR